MDIEKWNRKYCEWCGVGSNVYICIKINLEDECLEFPYTETNYCKKCWKKFGIKVAIRINKELKNY